MSDEKPTSSKIDEPSDEKSDGAIDVLKKLFADKLSLITSTDSEEKAKQKVIDDLTFEGLTKHWKQQGFKKIVTMVGAGISTSAGIPDFRSPGSGLYDNLQKYNLPHPAAIFELDYFHDNPQPFFTLAKELYPGTFNPTPSHYFVRLLHEKGLLLRHYTQNIDTLERIAGIPDEKLVEAHGTFYTNHCLGCRKLYSMAWMKAQIFADHVPTCTRCNSVVKPDIVFFGENLPDKFHTLPTRDFEHCDLLIIMGTSLEVQPFASLVDRPAANCLRLLINRTPVGNDCEGFSKWFHAEPSLLYDSPKNTRDIAYLGDCDDGVWALADTLGWTDELRQLIKREHEALAAEKTNVADDKSDKATTLATNLKEKEQSVTPIKETKNKKTEQKKLI